MFFSVASRAWICWETKPTRSIWHENSLIGKKKKKLHSSRCIWLAEIIKGPGFSTKAIWHKVVNPH